jgi:hypothetical protein
METFLIIMFWVFAFIGMGCTLGFVVSLFRGRGDNDNGGNSNKTAANNAKPSNNGGTANSTTPPPYNGGSKN